MRSYTFMERFRNAANAFSPTSTHTESHAVTFAESSAFDPDGSGALMSDVKCALPSLPPSRSIAHPCVRTAPARGRNKSGNLTNARPT